MRFSKALDRNEVKNMEVGVSAKDDCDNRSNQLNPNTSAYYSSRGAGNSDDDDFDEPNSLVRNHYAPRRESEFLKIVVTTAGDLSETKLNTSVWGGDEFLSFARKENSHGKPFSWLNDQPSWACVTILERNFDGFAYWTGTTERHLLLKHFNGRFIWRDPLASFLKEFLSHINRYFEAVRVKRNTRSRPSERPCAPAGTLSAEEVLVIERALFKEVLRHGWDQIQGFPAWLDSKFDPLTKEKFRACVDVDEKLEVAFEYNDEFGFPRTLQFYGSSIQRSLPKIEACLEYRENFFQIAKVLDDYLRPRGIQMPAIELLEGDADYSKYVGTP